MTYFFVGGSQRAGTTLLATSLCSGVETNPYLGESSGLRSLLHTYTYMVKRYEDESAFHFGSRQTMDDYYRSIVGLFLSHVLARHTPATSLVLKEPHMTTYFPQIFKLVPNSAFIIMKRDPRDILVSMLGVGKKMKEQGKKHLFNSGDLGKIAESIVPFYRPTLNACARNAKFASRCFWIDYEAMVTNPNESVEKLRQFTKLKLELFDAANPGKRTLAEKVASRKTSKNPSIWRTTLMNNQAISKSRIGNFTNELTTDDIKIIEAAIGDLITQLGYDLSSDK